MTYAETASARQAIGSGLLYNGINHVSCHSSLDMKYIASCIQRF